MIDHAFLFAHYSKKIEKLMRDTAHILNNSQVKEIRQYKEKLPEIAETNNRYRPLTIAFVGQYSAGKSTIVKALTGNEDILIDPGVSTDEVTAYLWNGVQLLDTPGIYAGNPHHDKLTLEAIDRSDLIIFVITNQLFDPLIGSYFKELAFKRKKAKKMMLVVNKISQSPGVFDVKMKDILKVIDPLTASSLPIVFMDAKFFTDSFEAEPDEFEELRKLSNVDEFIKSLNTFVSEKGILGRLLTPVSQLETILEKCQAIAQKDPVEEDDLLELLLQKKKVLEEFKKRYRSAIEGEMDKAKNDLEDLDNEYLDYIEACVESSKVARTKEDEITRKRIHRWEALAHTLENVTTENIKELDAELTRLFNSNLSKKIFVTIERERIRHSSPDIKTDPINVENLYYAESILGTIGRLMTNITKPAANAAKVGSEVTKTVSLISAVGEGAELTSEVTQGAEVAAAVIKGTEVAEVAAQGSEAAANVAKGMETASSTQADKLIAWAGKTLEISFKPEQIQKYVKIMGKVGTITTVLAGALGVATKIYEERQKKEKARKIKEIRNSVQRDCEKSLREGFRNTLVQIETIEKTIFDNEIRAVKEQSETYIREQEMRKKEAKKLGEILDKNNDLIEELQSR